MKTIQPSESLRKAIQKDRPNLKSISLNSYIVSLRSLFKRLNPSNDLSKAITTEFLRDKDDVMKDVDSQKYITTKKNILTAILVSLSSDEKKDDKLNDFYSLKLKGLNEKYNTFLDKQEKTESQKQNWINYDDFLKVINSLLAEVKKREIPKKEKLNRADYVLLQKYVILSFYQVYPIRNDIADTAVLTEEAYDKLDDDVRKKNNYFTKDGKKYKLYLNVFKNVARIGVKSFDIPEKLTKIVNLWLKHNKSGYLFTLGNGRDPLNPNGVTKLLNSIFSKYADGRKISSSLLRHISISEKLKNEPSILEEKKKAKETEDKYLHSSGMNERYRKLD